MVHHSYKLFSISVFNFEEKLLWLGSQWLCTQICCGLIVIYHPTTFRSHVLNRSRDVSSYGYLKYDIRYRSLVESHKLPGLYSGKEGTIYEILIQEEF